MRARDAVLWLGAALALASVACHPRERPTMDTWLPTWEATKSGIPARTSFTGARDEEICGRALGQLRQARERLLPAPDDDLDRLVGAWLRLAEEILFECPARWGKHTGFDEGYQELTRLAQEVDLAVRTRGGDPLSPGPEEGGQPRQPR